MTKKHGIDISTWQDPHRINYDLLAKNIDFAILRVGYTGHGTGVSLHKDADFEQHYKELHKRGVPLGVYWYSCANTKERGIREAEECLKYIKGKEFSYPIYIDTEDNYHQKPAGRKKLTDALVGFCETIEKAGYYAGIYSSTYWIKIYCELSRLERFDFWLAQWSDKAPSLAHGMWQYSAKGRVTGYAGDLDMNYAIKDYPAIIKSLGLNGYPKTKVGAAASKGAASSKKSDDEIAKEVLQGKWGNGQDRVERLKKAGYSYDSVQAKVNKLLAGSKKSVEEIAAEVVRGVWGNGVERKTRLEQAGYNYREVQDLVNKKLK